MNLSQALKKGFRTAEAVMGESDAHNLSIGSPTFKKRLSEEGVTLRQTPAQFLGAYSARVVADVTNNGTRNLWWRYNHPLAIADSVLEKAIGKEAAKDLGPVKKGLLIASVAIPGTAVAGAYDITNIKEMFRPQGFSQQYAEKGSEDRRETAEPLPELFDRFFLGRTGKPLKYETAKEEIPSLTPERYGNHLRNYYQDRGFLGIAKFTPENLKGVPEARMLGYPISIPMITTFAGGATGVAVGARSGATPRQRLVRGLAGGIAGSLTGIATGNITNEIIASANRPRLPTTTEYQNVQ